MDILFQIDPIAAFNIETDTSFALMLEAQSRGMKIWWCAPEAVSVNRGEVLAQCAQIEVADVKGAHFREVAQERRALSSFAYVLIRQDPPFDMAYFSNTFLLEHIPAPTIVLNSPRSIRNAPEKLSTLHLQELTPPTLISRDFVQIQEFAAQFEAIVLKPLSLAGGEGIERSSAADDQLAAKVARVSALSPEPIIAQKFLEGVNRTDKRVMALDGEIIGAVGRIPAEGEFRANVHAGGSAVATELTPLETTRAKTVAKALQEWGVFYAGIDFIDEYVTEINVTSPTLMRELKRLGGPDAAKLYWDRALAKRA